MTRDRVSGAMKAPAWARPARLARPVTHHLQRALHFPAISTMTCSYMVHFLRRGPEARRLVPSAESRPGLR
jgi:hypothetical protein